MWIACRPLALVTRSAYLTSPQEISPIEKELIDATFRMKHTQQKGMKEGSSARCTENLFSQGVQNEKGP